MKRSLAIVTIGMLTSMAGADSIAPYTAIDMGSPIDIYYDVLTNSFSITGTDDPIVYNRPIRGDLPVKIGPIVQDPTVDDCNDDGIDDDVDLNADGDNNPNTPDPDPSGKVGRKASMVTEDVHLSHPSNMAIHLTQLSVVMYMPHTGAHGRVYLYNNDSNNTDLPNTAGGITAAYARINIPNIPFPAGLYRLHVVNLDLRMPSLDGWVGFRMHQETASPVLAIADPSDDGVGSSKNEFGWSGSGTGFEPDRYTFGPEGPLGNFIISLHGEEVCPADTDFSGFVDLDDFGFFLGGFEGGTLDGDFDGSGYVDLDDYISFVGSYESGC